MVLSGGKKYTLKVNQDADYYGSYSINIGQQKAYTDVSSVTKVNDRFDFNQQINGYYFKPAVSGEYRFAFSGMPEGYTYGIQVNNPAGKPMINEYWYSVYGNTEGVFVTLTAGQKYLIKTKQNLSYYGDYCLDIGFYKQSGNISSYFAVNDSIQSSGQRNTYTFTPCITGSYEFGISNVPVGVSYGIQVLNPAGNPISNQYWYSSYSNGESQELKLSAGQVYTVIVRPSSYTYYGNYTLNIGNYKDPINIIKTIKDKIRYFYQKNIYAFTPSISGRYNLILSEMPTGYKYGIQVWNTAGDAISNQYWYSSYSNGGKQTVDLTAGQVYWIVVKQNENYLSDFRLTVEKQ